MTDRPRGAPIPLDRFELRDQLGRGGMGEVWSAVDRDLLREVAVKRLREDTPPGRREGRVAAFVAEARICARLEHPNIVPVYDVGWHDGEPFLVMRRIQGRSLEQALAAAAAGDERWTRERLVSALVQVCHAVGYAHERGVIHRDLTPRNVMLGRFGQVLVLDWGVALSVDDGAPVPGPEADADETTSVGTPGYMCPEIIGSAELRVDPRCDVFSIGAMLYEILTRRRAFPGDTIEERALATLTGAVHPRQLADVDEELAEICMKALAPVPADRYGDASALGRALVGWQDGLERRARARDRVAAGRRLATAWIAHAARLKALEARLYELRRANQPWWPIDDPRKQALYATDDTLRHERVAAAECFSELEAACEGALTLDPGSHEARRLLAEAYWRRYEDAEARSDAQQQAYFASRLRAYDDGTLAARLSGRGRLSLRTDPGGAMVIARRVVQEGLVWRLDAPRVLGATPLEQVELEQGSYVLVVRAPGYRDTRYPVRITRDGHWDVHAERPLPLYTDAQLGEGWIYVPEGPYLAGGDPWTSHPRPLEVAWVDGFRIREFPVTAAEYASFLHALAQQDSAEAARRLPRERHAEASALWPLPDPRRPYAFPLRDRDGDEWAADWPVMSISWFDARACAAWLASRWEPGVRLVSEPEFEKAARGVDGRQFPWGNQFDPALCHCLESREGHPRPESVGSFASDRSVYGVRDLAGNMRTWCREPEFLGNPQLRPMRGGYWGAGEHQCRAANRYGMEPVAAYPYLGIRLVAPVPTGPDEG